MAAMQIMTGDTGRVRAGSALRRLVLALWVGAMVCGSAALAQDGQGGEAADGGGESAGLADGGASPDTGDQFGSALGASGQLRATPAGAIDRAETAIETVDEILTDFLMRPQRGAAKSTSDAAAADTEGEADDGVVGLIQAPEGAPGVDADATTTEGGAVADLGAPGIASFAETQPQTRSLMPGPVGHPPVVVELFTSQGCSSCPPADDMLADLANREDILALSWHVDYWDYLGWADIFARPEFTRRQQAYAHASGERAIYTPQIIVGGRDTLIALRPAELMALLQAQIASPTEVMVTSSQQEGGYRIELTPRAAIPARVAIILVRYAPSRKVEITAGENRGTTVEYRNVVLAAERIAEWDGRVPLRMTVRPGAPSGKSAGTFPPDTRHAILAQEMDRANKQASGPILAAVRLD